MYIYLVKGNTLFKEVDVMSQPQVKRITNNQYSNNEIFNFDQEIIKEITTALKESKEGKIISNDNFEEYFCK